MSVNRFSKDPQSVLDYEWDWTPWLGAGESITAASITLSTGIGLNSTIQGTSTVIAWLSGGTAGGSYRVTCHITTSAGRQDDRTIVIDVGDR